MLSWKRHKSDYVQGETEENEMAIAVSYLDGPALESRICHNQTPEGHHIQTWSSNEGVTPLTRSQYFSIQLLSSL